MILCWMLFGVVSFAAALPPASVGTRTKRDMTQRTEGEQKIDTPPTTTSIDIKIKPASISASCPRSGGVLQWSVLTKIGRESQSVGTPLSNRETVEEMKSVP